MNSQMGYLVAKVKSKLLKEKDKKSIMNFFEKKGVYFPNGGPVWINSNIVKNEPHLISIGKNTTIAGNVEFVTHDNSISKVIPESTDLFGRIQIGDNCFIGARSVVLYGVTIADNVIVAAGSVVTRSIDEEYVIVGGNPAKVISSWESFKEKSKDYAWNLRGMSKSEIIDLHNNGEKLVRR